MSSRAKTKKVARDRGEESRHLGVLAEREVSYRCTQAGFTVNKSDEDTQGWDFFLQVPMPNETHALLDLAPPQLSCLLQVKGTASADGDTRMTLANALRLAKSPTPSFVLIASVSNSTIARWWLLHCGEAFIENVLKRLAKERQRQAETLNRIWLSLTGSDGELLSVDGTELRAAIARNVGTDTYAYLRQKELWLNTVGYHGATKSLVMSFDTTSPDERFVELARFAVGLEKSLPVDFIEVYDLRFGLQRHEASHRDVTLEIPRIPTGPAVTVELCGPNAETISFDGHTHVASAIFPFIPLKCNIIRVETEHFDIYTEHSRNDPKLVRVHWTLRGIDTQLSESRLADMSTAAKAMRWLLCGAAKITLRLKDGSHELPLGSPTETKSDHTEGLRDIENFGIVARTFGVQLGDMPVSAEALADQRQRLSILASVATGNDAQAMVKFPSDAVPVGFDLGERCALLLAPWLRTSRSVLVVVTAMMGLVTAVEGQPGARQLTCSRLMPLSKRIVPIGQEVRVSTMYDEAETLLNSMGIAKVYKPAETQKSA
ncbi:MAG: hypothetical protein IPK82_26565 [Polyangiaceae bacterium]|nr:hypothetical protein [Polyangiaceae bacterium]